MSDGRRGWPGKEIKSHLIALFERSYIRWQNRLVGAARCSPQANESAINFRPEHPPATVPIRVTH